jgi:hypothetical protein
MMSWNRFTALGCGCCTPRQSCSLRRFLKHYISKVRVVIFSTSYPFGPCICLTAVGLPLYLASSAFVRHSLNALYSNLQVTLRKVTVQNSGAYPSISRLGLTGGTGASEEESLTDHKSARGKSREKSLSVALAVTGTARVSGAIGEWEV